jgi:hypothetical protein
LMSMNPQVIKLHFLVTKTTVSWLSWMWVIICCMTCIVLILTLNRVGIRCTPSFVSHWSPTRKPRIISGTKLESFPQGIHVSQGDLGPVKLVGSQVQIMVVVAVVMEMVVEVVVLLLLLVQLV